MLILEKNAVCQRNTLNIRNIVITFAAVSESESKYRQQCCRDNRQDDFPFHLFQFFDFQKTTVAVTQKSEIVI